jgi:hypothetical protein
MYVRVCCESTGYIEQVLNLGIDKWLEEHPGFVCLFRFCFIFILHSYTLITDASNDAEYIKSVLDVRFHILLFANI